VIAPSPKHDAVNGGFWRYKIERHLVRHAEGSSSWIDEVLLEDWILEQLPMCIHNVPHAGPAAVGEGGPLGVTEEIAVLMGVGRVA